MKIKLKTNKKYLALLFILLTIIICSIIIFNIINKTKNADNNDNQVLLTSNYDEIHYSVSETTNNIKETIYYPKGQNPIKTEHIYTFKNNVVASYKMISYYETIAWAKLFEKTKYANDDIFVKTREKNVITFEYTKFEKRTYEEVLKTIEDNHKLDIKI